MNASTLATIHIVVVNIFLVIYLIKTVLLFSNVSALDKFSKAMKVTEMIVSTLFLATGIWLFVILGAIKVLQIVKLACIILSIPLAAIGFRKHKKGLALLSFLLIVGAYGLAEIAKNKPFIPNHVIVNGDENPAAGVKLYAANCAMCHGLDGKKKYRDAQDLSASSLDASLIPQMVKEGSKGKMPAFGGTLNDDEINEVSVYILALRGK